jgi:hypothetical protein
VATCGVYQLIWFISVCNEMRAFLGRDEPSWVKVFLLSTVTCGVYMLYWQIAVLGPLIQECQLRAGVPNASNPGWLLLVPYYNVILSQQELNRAWQGPA